MYAKSKHRQLKNTAKALGIFSLMLGAIEVAAPGTVSRAIGGGSKIARHNKPLLRTYGIREIATGVGILKSHKPAPWIWARVAGDGLDMAALANKFRHSQHGRRNIAIAAAAVAGITALDIYCAKSLSRKKARKRALMYNYSDRSGFLVSPRAMRGIARSYVTPPDMKAIPAPLTQARGQKPPAGGVPESPRKTSGNEGSRLFS